MNTMFYLSLVYDINGYDRLDLEKKVNLYELDQLIKEFSNANEVKAAYLNEYNINKKGRICLLFEDLDTKKKQLKEYNEAKEEDKERIKKQFSYVHIIPIMYKNQELLNFASCLPLLKNYLHKINVQIALFKNDITNKGEIIKRNKMYLFETEQEKDLIINEAKYREAIDLFLDRIKKLSPEKKYFYCRALSRLCHLSISIIKTKYGQVVVYDSAKDKRKKSLTKTEILEEESKNMDDFYTYHDLDEVIKYSPDENRPIGSERRNRL